MLQTKTDADVIKMISYILILAGALTFIVSFLGYCGAMFESRCLLCVVSPFQLEISILLSYQRYTRISCNVILAIFQHHISSFFLHSFVSYPQRIFFIVFYWICSQYGILILVVLVLECIVVGLAFGLKEDVSWLDLTKKKNKKCKKFWQYFFFASVSIVFILSIIKYWKNTRTHFIFWFV